MDCTLKKFFSLKRESKYVCNFFVNIFRFIALKLYRAVSFRKERPGEEIEMGIGINAVIWAVEFLQKQEEIKKNPPVTPGRAPEKCPWCGFVGVWYSDKEVWPDVFDDWPRCPECRGN